MKRLLYVLLISNIAVLGILLGLNREVSALTYSEAVDVRFTFNPSISVNLSAADLRINDLAPGSADDSNIITVSVASNSASGYVLSANVGNNTTYNTRNLIRSDSTDNFASIAFGSSMASLTTDNTWGFSYKPSGDGTSWTNYSGLPLYSDATNTATLISTSDAMDSKSVQFKIGAKAASTMPSGTYNNVINFILVANPEPTPAPISCSANTICYSSNAVDTVEGTMGNQTSGVSANSTVMLLASNFSRTGFGFAGWNTAPDYSGTSYGPQEDVTMPSDMSNGLPLYAIWVKSAGAMQSWNGCVGLNIGDVTALTDARDNDTYAVAKLADGKCWMIENLRLDSTADHNSDGSLAQGYGTSTTYGNFSGLADAESTNFDTTTANSLYYSGTQDGTATIDIGTTNSPSIRMPRYNNTNTSARASTPTTNGAAMYSYGNYYTWHAAIADTTYYSSGDHGTTSLCPTGWRLPVGNQSTATNSFGALSVALGGPEGGATATTSSTPTGTVMSKTFRSYPNNFLYSGWFSGSSVSYMGSRGGYWSSTVYSINYPSLSSNLYLYNPYVHPGTDSSHKSYGLSIRCTAGS